MNLRQAFQIGTVRGIPIRIHFSFLLILPFLAYLFSQSFVEAARLAGVPPAQLSGAPWMWGLLIALALFASVLLHELAHSLYAVAHGGKVRSITLLMIGGISELTEAPRRPAEEAWMALAGPATSLLAGGAFYLLLVVTRGSVGFDGRFALYYLAQLNVVLGLFNLLPAFPLDGGRILRALLARRHGPVRATQVAAAVGKAIAVLLGLSGLASGNFLLAIIAFFVFIGAQAEQHAVLARAILGELRVRELMGPQPVAVTPEEDLFGIGERMLREKRLFFPVVEGGSVRGTVTAQAVEHVPLGRRATTRVREVMLPASTVSPDDRVADALRLFAERRAAHLLVVEGDRLVGVVSESDVMRGLRLQELAASQHPAPDTPSAGAGSGRTGPGETGSAGPTGVGS